MEVFHQSLSSKFCGEKFFGVRLMEDRVNEGQAAGACVQDVLHVILAAAVGARRDVFRSLSELVGAIRLDFRPRLQLLPPPCWQHTSDKLLVLLLLCVNRSPVIAPPLSVNFIVVVVPVLSLLL
jgi:hypothetical protein